MLKMGPGLIRVVVATAVQYSGERVLKTDFGEFGSINLAFRS